MSDSTVKSKPADATGQNSAAEPRSIPRRKVTKPKAARPTPDAELKQLGDDAPARSAWRSWFYALSSWSVSLIVHMVMLIVLALWYIALPSFQMPQMVAVAERPQEFLTQLLDQRDTPATSITSQGALSESTSSEASHSAPITGAAPQVKMDPSLLDPNVEGPRIGPLNVATMSARTFGIDVSEEAPGDPQSVVDNMDEAMDRITQEILLMLSKGPVLVVWLLDESESMKDDQKEIRNKIHRVYQELGLTGATKGDALLTGVASYGAQLHIHSQRPTSKIEEIQRYFDQVPIDNSGEEQMCLSIGRTIRYFRRFAKRKRQMALILVTDESGDPKTNASMLEATLEEALSAKCRIYVLGREAVFGYPYAHFRWTDPKTGIVYWLRVNRGPETPFVEQLQTNGLWRRYDAHPSGFGPYEQARLAWKTGGVFFMLPSPEVNLVHRDDRKYALSRIRPYMPFLGSRQEYLAQRNQSKLRSVIWKVINDLNPYDPQKAKYVVMREHFSLRPQEFRRQAQQEIAKAAMYMKYLNAAIKALEEVKEERERETDPRWQANYDLIYAQLLAYRVRMYEYGAYLEYFMKNPKQPKIKPPRPQLTVTFWDIRTRAKTITGEKTASEIRRAREALQAVAREHEGTPWAARAQWELRRGFGIHLVQDWDDPRRGKNVKLPKL